MNEAIDLKGDEDVPLPFDDPIDANLDASSSRSVCHRAFIAFAFTSIKTYLQ